MHFIVPQKWKTMVVLQAFADHMRSKKLYFTCFYLIHYFLYQRKKVEMGKRCFLFVCPGYGGFMRPITFVDVYVV